MALLFESFHLYLFFSIRRTFAKKGFPADFAVKKNIFIEEWNGKREITNLTFKFRAEDIPTFLFLIILFPYGLYTVARMDLHNGGDRRFKELF
jgi:hypothetical protein